VKELCRTLLGSFAAAIVASGRLDLSMAGELLHRAQIRACIKQVADECSSQACGENAATLA
jgi:hypothetical protein